MIATLSTQVPDVSETLLREISEFAQRGLVWGALSSPPGASLVPHRGNSSCFDDAQNFR